MEKPPDWNDLAKCGDAESVRHAFDRAGATSATSAQKPKWTSARALQTKEFPPVCFVVTGYIAEGCTLFAGRPKIGKSWLMLEVAIAVAQGSQCLGGIECTAGDVLYLALEDNERRLKRRLQKLMGTDVWPGALSYATEWPKLREGGVDLIREWIKSVPNARLVVVDVLASVRSPEKANQVYQGDYDTIRLLQQLASETGVAIVAVTHVRKGKAEGDPFEKVSGTLGQAGAADTVLILDSDSNGVTMYGRGRDIEEIETAVSFDKETCRWRVLGSAEDVRRTDERSSILNALFDAEAPLSPAEISRLTGNNRNNVDQLLSKMVRAGEVSKAGRGKYVHPNHSTGARELDKNDKKIRTSGPANPTAEGPAEVVDLTSYRSYRSPPEPSPGSEGTSAASAPSPGSAIKKDEGSRSAPTPAKGGPPAPPSRRRAPRLKTDDDDLALPDFLDRNKHPRPSDPNWQPPP